MVGVEEVAKQRLYQAGVLCQLRHPVHVEGVDRPHDLRAQHRPVGRTWYGSGRRLPRSRSAASPSRRS